MSDGEPPLQMHYSQEQFRRQSSLITQAEFLFLIQIQCVKYISQDTLFIGENVLEIKIER